MLDEILRSHNLSFDELTKAEKDTLDSMLNGLSTKTITAEDMKQFIKSMRDVIENELINEPEFIYVFVFKVLNRKQIFLKARLRNCMVLESFLTGPEKARKVIESALLNIPNKSKI